MSMHFISRTFVSKSLSIISLLLMMLFSNVVRPTKANSSWLLIGDIAASSTFGRHMCDQIPLTPQQKHQCEKDPRSMASVRDGARLSIQECQFQFRNNRWNCLTNGKSSFVGVEIIERGTQEAAFVRAIASAGVAYAVTLACSRGDLDGCSCDKKKRGPARNDNFEWGGCSDDVRYGMRFAENFIDACEMGMHDAHAKVNRHNNRVGRRAVKKFIKRKCKCHGPTASCPTRTCWDELESFRRTGKYLKSRYEKAAHVTVKQDGSIVKMSSKAVGQETKKRPRKEQLVYLERSPNYCVRNEATGSPGTSGRECNKKSKGKDGCNHLCCGRGYDTTRVTRTEQCQCKFYWCCEVTCRNCTQELDIHTCKPEIKEKDFEGHVIVVEAGNSPSRPVLKSRSVSKRRPRDNGRKTKAKRMNTKRSKMTTEGEVVVHETRNKRDVQSSSSIFNWLMHFRKFLKENT